MPHDSSTEPDTRRLLPDGSAGRGRPAPPPPAGPSAEPATTDPASAVAAETDPAAEVREPGPGPGNPADAPARDAAPAASPSGTSAADAAPDDVPRQDDGQTEGPEATVVIPALDGRPAVDSRPDDRAPDGPESAPPEPAAPEPAATASVPDAGDTIEFRRDLSAAPRAAEATTGGATVPVDLPPGGPSAGGAGDDDGAGGDGDGDGPPAGASPGGPSGNDRPWWRRRAVLAPAAAVLALGAVYGLDLAVAGDDIPRGTVVAGLELGGLSPAAAGERLASELAPRMSADHTVVADDVQAVLHPPAAGIALDVPATVDAADDQPLNPWTRLVTLVGNREVDPVVTEDETALAAQLEQLAAQVDRAPVDATIAIEGTTASVVEPVDGRTLDRDSAATAITEALADGGDPAEAIALPVEVAEVQVGVDEAQRVLDETVTPALSAPVTVVGADGAESVELPVSAIAASLTFTPQDDGTLEVAVDPAALQAEMGEDFSVFGTPAQDARFDIDGDSISVVPSVGGQGIDPAVLAGQLLPVLRQEAPREVTATLGPVPASFTTEQAEALGITEEVSSFTTDFTNTASGTNIRVVAEEVDGALVLPGETFSLNTLTGPRGTAQGYVPAGVISNGEFSTAVGGGISQFATTMFNAVFFAGLEDVYHKPHSYYISRYPAGREATVYEGVIDLQWRNDTETGIYVQTEWDPGSITVRFWGTKYYDIESISSNRYAVTQPVVQEKVDDGSGSCEPQSGSTGFSITVTRVFNDPATGAELRREDFRTRYAAEPVIRCVPPPPPPEAPPGAPGATPPTLPTPTG
ncbi:VanW family protein [Modestobacter lapidis]|nr:vanomycin resistance protein VanB [Modestobacter lapidis]